MALSIEIDEPSDEKHEQHEEEGEEHKDHPKEQIPESEEIPDDRKESLLMDAHLAEKIPDSIVDNTKEDIEDSPKSL